MRGGRWAGRRWLWVAGLAVAALLVAVVVRRIDSRPSVSKPDVGAIVDAKVGAAVQAIQSAPPPGVGVYDAIRGPLVVIQASGGSAGDADLGSGIVVNASGAVLTAL